MKRFISLLVLIALAVCLLSCSYRGTYEDGYADGYIDGYSDAEFDMQYVIEEEFLDGYDIGYDDGYWEGSESSDDEGYDTGYEDGYSEGEFGGYYAGATYTCLFFGDVDRAFQSANNGIAWYTFLDAYDEYITNIFDDDETRSALFWALISATLGDGVTEEEKELLVSTFGESLFIRNGVELTERS